MKLIFLFLIILGRDVGLAEETPTPYTTKPNTSGYPFPTAFPVLTNGRELQFDWKRYLGEAISAGDKVYRAHLARSNGFTSQNTEMEGVGDSAFDTMTRNKIAADEVSNGCDLLEAMYRERLKNEPGLLATLEEFITHHRRAIEASIKLVGGSWNGGSGARVAYPAAKLTAFVHYRAALLDLRSSLHFQDFPEIVFPTPSKAAN
jgi:acetyl esterase/lipase